MKRSQYILSLMLILSIGPLYGQLKVSDKGNIDINRNAILDLESDSLGLLLPRVAIGSLDLPAPLMGPVTPGMLVYSSGGNVNDGFYYWDGAAWTPLSADRQPVLTISRSTGGPLEKQHQQVLARNDITLSLPEIGPSDDGLSITVKNIGTFSDLVVVVAADGASIDGLEEVGLTRWKSQAFIASDGRWIAGNSCDHFDRIMEISPASSWTSLEEALSFLDEHMAGPTVIKLTAGSYPIRNTIRIDLPFPLVIQGLPFGMVTLVADQNFSGIPMFRCASPCYFQDLIIEAPGVDVGAMPSLGQIIQAEGDRGEYDIQQVQVTPK